MQAYTKHVESEKQHCHNKRVRNQWPLKFQYPNQVEQKLLTIHEAAEKSEPNFDIFILFMVSPQEGISFSWMAFLDPDNRVTMWFHSEPFPETLQ